MPTDVQQPGTPTRPPWVPDDLYPFEDRWIDVDGARIHLVDEGDGPPLLFLHGNPTWSFLYRDVIRGLRDRFRCLALDHPGLRAVAGAAGLRLHPRRARPRGRGARRPLDLRA